MGDWQWKCEADLPEALRMGKVEVSCEGWENADDPYVLSGSCGLTYNLIEDARFRTSKPQGKGTDWGALIFWFFFLGILFIIIKGWYTSLRGPSTPGAPGSGPRGGGGGGWWPWGGGFGGGGWGTGNTQPPPPYSKDEPGSSSSSTNAGGWRPGFWTGIAAGVIGDRLFQPRQRQQYQQQQQGGGFFGRQNYGRQGGGFMERDDDDGHPFGGFRGAGAGRAGPSRTGSSGSGMGSMRRSTGFGGTSNR
ncbi:unnamed protein product [Tilletia controversa]|nr:unnamed protein product [Tilletia controversa]